MKRLAVMIVIFVATPGVAQKVITPPPFVPAAPTALSPNGAINNANLPALRWRQGGFFATQPQPPAARFFRICVHDVSQSCATPIVEWTFAANDAVLNRVPYVPPVNSPQVPSTYAYTFYLPPNTIPLDTLYHWKVSACAGHDPASCSDSPERSVRLSTKNIKALNLVEIIGNRSIEVAPSVQNTGSTSSGAFTVSLRIHNALMDPGYRCVTSVGGAEPGDVAVLRNGQEVPVSTSEVPGAIAIYRPSVTAEYVGSSSLSLAAGAMGSGMAVTHAPQAALPAAYLLVMRADDPEVLAEFDENDNARAECHIVFP